MTVVYPAYFLPDTGDSYLVSVPDLHSCTEGDTLADAIYMARDLIGIMCVELQDEGKELPQPGAVPYDGALGTDGVIRNYVDVDLTAYRRSLDNKMVKKNCTIPNYLAVAAERANINFSKVLQEAIAQKLGMTQTEKAV